MRSSNLSRLPQHLHIREHQVLRVLGVAREGGCYVVPNMLGLLLTAFFENTVAQGGSWGPNIEFPIIPVAAYIIPELPESHRMMVYSAYSANSFGGSRGITQFAEIDFRTGAVSARQVSDTQHDMFCPGMSSLADGRLTSIYNPSTGGFTSGANMQISRGYQSSTVLSNGKVFTIGGSWSGVDSNKTGEVYDPSANAWSLLPGADVAPMLTSDHEGKFREDNHAWLFAWRNGSVFQAGPSKAMNWYYTDGQGGVSPAGIRDSANDAMCGVNVMYDIGKIFSAGGSQYYDEAPGLSVAHLISIDQVGAPAVVEKLPSMKYARAFANVVVLPDGKILVTGGQGYAKGFTDRDPVFAPEIFDPSTKKFTELAPDSIPRNYHSVAILLADGTVFSGGGGLCWDDGTGAPSARCRNTVDHPNGAIFTPPYLKTEDVRPVISGLSSTVTRPGGELRATIIGSAEGVTFSLIRIGSVTHNINSDQRRIPLVPETIAGTEVVLRLPGDSGVVLPGYWYLFAVSAQGVPSIAKTVMVQL
ncbi:galactose oxidase [Ophiobolus disseminans]|uniref:Galactose oxidase n=1 Tax=Ophiobolus disseminans TaxID=1469910 RepID=A0A6A6ZH42_9PLEO|nr:galactose oxidase [Ophiobolus disseminans]